MQDLSGWGGHDVLENFVLAVAWTAIVVAAGRRL
jgi:hypothetical protein